MAGVIRSASVRLDAIVSPYMAGLTKASVATKAFSTNTNAQLSGTTAKTQKLGQATSLLPAQFGALATAGGAAFAGIGVAAAFSVKKFMDFDVAMDAVGASTGATSGELEKLSATAIKAAQNTKFGAVEAAGGIEALGKAGVKTADIIGGGLQGALDLAAAGGTEVAVAAELAAGAMTQFALSGKDVPHVADLMAAAAGKAQGSVDDMALAFKQSGLVASQMGLSIEETTGTLAAFASNALIGSDAGTSFRSMLVHLMNPTAKSRELMDELGIAVFDAQGNFVGMEALAGQLQDRLGGLTQEQRTAALAIMFGQDAIRGANVLYQQGAEGIAGWTEDVNDSGFAAEQAAKRTDNLKGDLERLGGAVEALGIKLGGTADGPLRDFVQGLEEMATEVSDEIDLWGDYADNVRDFFTPSVTELEAGIRGVSEETVLAERALSSYTAVTEGAEAGTIRLTGMQEQYGLGTQGVTNAVIDATEATVDQTGALQELQDEYFEAAETFLGVRDGVRGWEQALDDATTALANNGATMDITEQAGRDNQAALDDMAAAALGVLEQMVATGQNTDTAARQMRRSLIDTGIEFGMTEADAIAYADQVIATAKLSINTPVAVDDTTARAKLAAWNEAVRTGGGTITFSINAIEAAGARAGFGGSGGSGFTGGFPLPAGTYRRSQGPHDGGAIDYAAPRGTPIRATFSGSLLNRDLGNRSYGKYYTLTGGGKYELGAHLMGFARPSGPVSAGSLIGWVDSTGNSTGNHLHLLRNFHTGGWTDGGPINTSRGEYVVNPSAAAANRGLIEAINAGGGSGGAIDLSPRSTRLLARMLREEMSTAVGAAAYAAGARANMLTRS